jgi:hypothetical protein
LFGNTIPQTISQLDQRDFFPRQQFGRLQKGDLIRPLRLAPHIDSRRLEEYSKEEFTEWRSTLEAFIHHESMDTEGDGERGLPRDLILNRDAAVLAQLFSINDDLIRRKVPVKVVLITEDEKIHYAVAYRKKYEQYKGENFLRRPIQFLPVLNFQEMPNIVYESRATLEIRSVIDSILRIKADITKGFLHELIYQLAIDLKKELQPRPSGKLPDWKTALQEAWHKTLQTSFDIDFAPRIGIGRDRVRTAWDNLSNNAVSLNVQLLARRFRQELGPLASALSHLKETGGTTQLATAFEVYQAEQLEVLERQHIEWSLEWLIADLARRPPGHVGRGPRLIRQDRLGIANNRPLEAAVRNMTDKHFARYVALDADQDSFPARLYVLVNINLISAFAFFGFEDLYSSKVPNEWLESSLNVVRSRLHNLPRHLPIPLKVCEWRQKREGRGKQRLAKEIIAECEHVLENAEGPLTLLDRDMLKRYQDRLTAHQHATLAREKLHL